MKTIKIFALGSHLTKERTGGVDFARIVQPAKYLNGYKDGEVEFVVNTYDPIRDVTMDWLRVAEDHDIIFFNYTAMPWEFAKMGLMARKFNRKMVMDVDDALMYIKPDNPVYTAFKPGSENIKNFVAICNEVDYLTVTNGYLRNVMCRHSKKAVQEVGVIDNFIDLENMWTYRPPFKDTHEITIMHMGSTTHFMDLAEENFVAGVDMVMKRYPNVTLLTVGALLPQLKHKWGQRYRNDFGHQDIYKWAKDRFPEFARISDIVVAPLADTVYDRCKSAIKFLEYSSAKKPGVYQNIRQYREVVVDGENGYIASSSNEWFEALSKLIEDSEHRKKVGEAAFNTVRERTIQSNVYKYASFFKSILK